jgi:DNA-binding Lrp family transcriptional regulator
MTLVQREQADNVNSRTVQLVRLLTELGPDVPEIARRLGQFKESVRYRYKEKILNKGFAVQAAVDHERLGLKRVMLVADFSETYKNYAAAILTAMSEVSYVVSFAKSLIGGEYVVNLSVPSELIGEVREFLLALKERGMFAKLEILEFEWARIVPMKPDFYDFDTGRWDFEWQNPAPQDYEAAAYLPSKRGKFDYIDLLIIKELQMDANKSMKEIAEKLNINYKKLAWHHTAHVRGRKLLSGYTVNWMGTRYDYNLEKALHRKHRYFAIDFLVKDTNEFESMTLRHEMDRLPFLWSEGSGRNYFAELAVPVDYVVEGLQYLGNTARGVKEKMSLHAIDQTEAARFTIPYSLYDPATKTWIFDREELVKKFEKLIMQIKIGGAS